MSWRLTTPADARNIMRCVDAPWWIAGGWALDLFIGVQTRPHKDLDVGVRRSDAAQVMARLRGWEFFEAHQGTLARIERGSRPRAEVNSLWGRPDGDSDWMVELMLEQCEDETWIFRRDPSMRRSFTSALRHTADGMRYLAPEIQLLYKARDLRPADQMDFERTAPLLGDAAGNWLRACLERLYPQHPWLAGPEL